MARKSRLLGNLCQRWAPLGCCWVIIGDNGSINPWEVMMLIDQMDACKISHLGVLCSRRILCEMDLRKVIDLDFFPRPFFTSEMGLGDHFVTKHIL